MLSFVINILCVVCGTKVLVPQRLPTAVAGGRHSVHELYIRRQASLPWCRTTGLDTAAGWRQCALERHRRTALPPTVCWGNGVRHRV